MELHEITVVKELNLNVGTRCNTSHPLFTFGVHRQLFSDVPVHRSTLTLLLICLPFNSEKWSSVAHWLITMSTAQFVISQTSRIA